MVKIGMPQRKREVRTIDDLTDKQRKFIDILVDNWGSISKTDAYLKAGYETKGSKIDKGSVAAIASKLTNPKINPHICRYLEIRLQQEQEKYEKDKLRRYKIFERLRNGAETKGQYTGAINAEFRAGQLAGQFVDKKEIAHTTLEGMSRDKLEERLKELENKIKDADNIIDVTPEGK